MAKNWKNHYIDNAVHHITGTVHQWQPVLLFPPIADIVMEELIIKENRWNAKIWGYIIMPEHFHLMVQSENGENIKRFLHGFRRYTSSRVKVIIDTYNMEFGEFCNINNVNTGLFYGKIKDKSVFRFWKEKPRVFPITREDEIQRKLDYIHNNAVRRGLVKSPDQWKYSSFKSEK
jgi:REP element-mobilizing transposase RayT